MLGLKEAACDLLSENQSPFVFKDSDRVFLMHQGYCFDFLRGSGFRSGSVVVQWRQQRRHRS